MKKTLVYIHGRGGNPKGADQYSHLFTGYEIIGFDYKSAAPWEAKIEFPEYFTKLYKKRGSLTVLAESIGAYFAVESGIGRFTEKAFFISPVVYMERLIGRMMSHDRISEDELREKGEIVTQDGILSWKYLSYVKNRPIEWNVPTDILYGECDRLIPKNDIDEFTARCGASLTVMKGGEHWFHTEKQMSFLESWLAVSLQHDKAFKEDRQWKQII